MNLNSTVLVEELGSLCVAAQIKTDPKTTNLNRVEIASEEAPQAQGEQSVLLVAGALLDWIKVPSNSTIVIYDYAGTDIDLKDYPENDVILLSPSTKLWQALSEIQQVFVKYNDWLERLNKILDRNGTVDELVEASIPIFECNTMIIDNSFRVISYALYGKDQSGNRFSNVRSGSALSKEQIDLLKTSFRMNPELSKPFMVKGPHSSQWIDGRRDMSINVTLSGEYVIRINLSKGDGKGDVPDKLFPALQEFGNYLRYASLVCFPHDTSPQRSRLSDCLARLYNGEMIPRAELEAAATDLNWDYREDLFIVFLAVPLTPDGRRSYLTTQSLTSIANRVTELSNESVTSFPDDTLCAVLNYSNAGLSMDDVKELFNDAAKENNLLIAYAIPCSGLRHTKNRYEQLASILNHLFDQPRKAGAYLVEDLAFDFAYNCLKREIQPLSLVPYGLIMLVNHDNTKSSELYPTLRAYVECDCSPSKTIKKLFIERSTFYYRLRQAIEILNMDLEDPDVKLKLLLSFKILDNEPKYSVSMI